MPLRSARWPPITRRGSKPTGAQPRRTGRRDLYVRGAPSIVNLGKRRAGVRYAWYVCGTVNAKPFLSVLSHNVVIDREIDTSRAKDCGK